MTQSFCRTAIRSLFLLGAISLAAASVSAQESAGFHPLFNGKDLTGWVTPDDKSLFTVENGEVVGRTNDKPLKKNEFLAAIPGRLTVIHLIAPILTSRP
jgi:hypothetical protein